ncbi:hypothetical protein Presley_45 [Acinetobacter phage Presley]|uniref:Uncharacterized protein n=1 Tax=Acinetobacter phage Presley TaxID=1406780 RepID=U5PZP1_9CAUD|nr:hypothetical protein Presley_45 [Acinetobacter phage Presley]AGY48112.1 hypothetical protein Presley_45 [Acinetobacter phage Presley]
MNTLEEVLVNRKNIYILIAATDAMHEAVNFIRQLSKESLESTVITDPQGGILFRDSLIYQLAENPMKSTDEWQQELEDAK